MFTNEIVWIDGLASGKRMITRQKNEKRLRCHQFVFEIRLFVPPEESDIQLATLQVVGQRCRVLAGNRDFDIEQLVVQDAGWQRGSQTISGRIGSRWQKSVWPVARRAAPPPRLPPPE